MQMFVCFFLFFLAYLAGGGLRCTVQVLPIECGRFEAVHVAVFAADIVYLFERDRAR